MNKESGNKTQESAPSARSGAGRVTSQDGEA